MRKLKPSLRGGQRPTRQSSYDAGLLRYARNDEESQITARVGKKYAVRVTDHVRSTIKGDVTNDPIARQYIPQLDELKILPEERIDPIGDEAHSPVKGIVHRHPNRVLLKIVNVCAVYCRFCFRREMIGPGAEALTKEELRTALDYIAAHPEIEEVILTGGDPLILSPAKLRSTLNELCEINHVEILRIHTRVPIADPGRITPEMITALQTDKPLYMAVHVNHPDELTPEVDEVLKSLRFAGCVILSQSVLLRGVNDDPQVLAALFQALIKRGVKPYYLHHPDLAPGTSHFRLSIAEGRTIVKALRPLVSGLAMPAYMLDIPGGYGKVPLEESPIEEAS